jgi:chromosome segregation ATPase
MQAQLIQLTKTRDESTIRIEELLQSERASHINQQKLDLTLLDQDETIAQLESNNSRLLEESTFQTQKISDLSSKISSGQLTHDELTQLKILSLESQNQSLSDQISDQKNSYHLFQNDHENLKFAQEISQKDIRLLESELESKKTEIKNYIKDAQKDRFRVDELELQKNRIEELLNIRLEDQERDNKKIIEGAIRELEGWKVRFIEKDEEAKDAVAEWKGIVGVRDEEIGALRKVVAGQDLELVRSGRLVGEWQVSVDKKNGQVELLGSENDRLRGKVLDLQEQLDAKIGAAHDEHKVTLERMKLRDVEFKKSQDSLEKLRISIENDQTSLQSERTVLEMRTKDVENKSLELDSVIAKYDLLLAEISEKRGQNNLEKSALDQQKSDVFKTQATLTSEYSKLKLDQKSCETLQANWESKNADLGIEKMDLQKRFDELKWKFEKFDSQKRELESLNEERYNDYKWALEKFNLEKKEYESHKEAKMREIAEGSRANGDVLVEIEKRTKEIAEMDSEARGEREFIKSLNSKNKQQLDDLRRARDDLEKIRKDKGDLDRLAGELETKEFDLNVRVMDSNAKIEANSKEIEIAQANHLAWLSASTSEHDSENKKLKLLWETREKAMVTQEEEVSKRLSQREFDLEECLTLRKVDLDRWEVHIESKNKEIDRLNAEKKRELDQMNNALTKGNSELDELVLKLKKTTDDLAAEGKNAQTLTKLKQDLLLEKETLIGQLKAYNVNISNYTSNIAKLETDRFA